MSSPPSSCATRLRGGEVAAIDDQREPIRRDHERRGRREQAGQVRDVRERGDDERVERRGAQVFAQPRVSREV